MEATHARKAARATGEKEALSLEDHFQKTARKQRREEKQKNKRSRRNPASMAPGEWYKHGE